jgi:hypothetical protein
MLFHFLNLLQGLLQLALALIPLAIWQRTRINGFLWIAVGLAGDTLATWASAAMFALRDGGAVEPLMLVSYLMRFLVLAVTAFGFWQVYTALRRREAEA